MNLYKSKLKIVNGIDGEVDTILLAKIILLELFSPKLFRFIKNGRFAEAGKLQEWSNHEVHKSLTSTDSISKAIIEEHIPQKEKEIYTKLIQIVKEVNDARVSFSLDAIFRNIDIKRLESYIKLKALEVKEISKVRQVPADITRFEEYIFSDDAPSWEKAFSEDVNLKLNLLEMYDGFSDKAKDKVLEPEWLEIVSKHLSREDFMRLIEKTTPIERLLDGR